RQLLRDQLGVEPDDATRALYEQIRTESNSEVTGRKVKAARVTAAPAPQPDLLEIPEVARLYGREAELAQLEHWIADKRCRVVALLGRGGVGKPALAAPTVHAVAAQFEIVFWCSLLNAPPLDEIMSSVLQVVSGHSLPDVPAELDAQLALLVDYLR